jgi:hypothetical protein
MKRLAGFVFLSVAVVALFGWMLTTPLLKIIHSNEIPAVADGAQPAPPPPFSVVNGVTLADGAQPAPPPPFSVVNGITLADGAQPAPPPPFAA